MLNLLLIETINQQLNDHVERQYHLCFFHLIILSLIFLFFLAILLFIRIFA